MWIEIVLFNTKRSRKLSSVVQVFNAEIDVIPACQTFNNISCSWVDKITSVVAWSALLVDFITRFVLNHNDVTFFVTLPISEHIMHVEISFFCVRNTDQICFFHFKCLKVLVVAKFNSGIFLFKCTWSAGGNFAGNLFVTSVFNLFSSYLDTSIS